MNDPITLAVELPENGQDFTAIVDVDVIAVRIADQICVAHRTWMTLDQARAAAAAIERLVAER